jgi:uncharacterized protein (DUF362 family)
MKQSTVEIAQVQGSIAETLEQTLKNFPLKRKKRIFIKPNICAPKYVAGAVTTPQLLHDLVCLLRDSAEEVIVGESNGYNFPCWEALKGTGIEDIVKKAGATVVNLSEDKLVEVKLKNSPVEKLYLPKTIMDADAIVDVPTMKTHEFKTFSGAIKNLFGCLPDERRIFLHSKLDEVLFQLYSILSPDLTVMDAVVAMEGNGPTAGKTVKMDLILTGDDAFTVDVTATKLMGINWKKIGYLALIAQKTGFREENFALKGCRIADHARKFELPRIDLPVEAQLRIYKSPFMTKVFFCSLGVVKLLQKATITYRKSKERKALSEELPRKPQAPS